MLGYVYVNVKENHIKCFYNNYDLKTRKPSCYKNSESPICCIDLMLTNVPCSF